jgi:hypothetical protein
MRAMLRRLILERKAFCRRLRSLGLCVSGGFWKDEFIPFYRSMMPAQEDDEALKNWRINSWCKQVAPEGYASPGGPIN